MLTGGKKSLKFPQWADGLISAGLLGMGGVEWWHGQMGWAALFVAAGLILGATLIVRIARRGPHDES